MNLDLKKFSVGVIGLGYVGMPLALRLSQNVRTVGFDINETRVENLVQGEDSNGEITPEILRTTTCSFTSNLDDIKGCNIYIITVPTPVDSNNKPDLSPIEAASRSVAKFLNKGDIVVYESTVYPGVTEGYCGALIEEVSGLESGKDFYLGYSPERINPGDKEHTVENITKVVSGQTEEVTEILCALYSSVTGGKVFKAKDIMTAEASKAIENAQRDINVAFVNEITMILNKMGLSAYDVLEAAGTKWNFLPFVPGLVGGHCISVDPYYLAQCAERVGHKPEVILSGRKINDDMGVYVGEAIQKALKESGKKSGGKVLILGFTFKENINDIRNTKVIDVMNYLKTHGYDVDVHDPHALKGEVKAVYGFDLIPSLSGNETYDAIVPIVSHDTYKAMSAEAVSKKLNSGGIIFDMKCIWKNLSFDAQYPYKTL